MFDWFRKKDSAPLEFADNRAAFDYACSHLPNRILLEAVLPAIVEEEGRRGHDGERFYRIRLAAANGGRDLWTSTVAEAVDWPCVGDLVGFRVVMIAEDIAPEAAPIGFITAVLAPVLVEGKRWKVARNLTPANIRTAIRY